MAKLKEPIDPFATPQAIKGRPAAPVMRGSQMVNRSKENPLSAAAVNSPKVKRKGYAKINA